MGIMRCGIGTEETGRRVCRYGSLRSSERYEMGKDWKLFFATHYCCILRSYRACCVFYYAYLTPFDAFDAYLTHLTLLFD